jgi:methylthioribose-1-phosphate isomerase
MLNYVGGDALQEGVFWCVMRTIEWLQETNEVQLIDQRLIPNRLEYLRIHSAAEMAEAIRSMAIRGAPALGVAGAFGVALEALAAKDLGITEFAARLKQVSELIIASRPTAVNLAWGVNRVLLISMDMLLDQEQKIDKIVRTAQEMAEEDIAANLRMAEFGASLIADGDTIITHCNTGSLAAVDWGTALGAIRYAHEHGKQIKLLVDETRPRFQGARLTAWECQQYGIPFEVISDNMAGYFLRRGDVQKVFFGSDRVTANGDVINKVGTYMLSLAAHANHVPVYPVFPLTTLDMSISSGDFVQIEERGGEEVTGVTIAGESVFPAGVIARNPAFDVTPHELITALVTDRGICYPPFSLNLPQFIYNSTSGR